MESTLPLVQVAQARTSLANSANATSPKSPKFLPRNHTSLPDDGEKIRLHLRTWARVLDEAVNTSDQQLQKVSKILKFFIKAGTLNGLATTPSVKSLEDAVAALPHGGELTKLSKKTDWKKRISQLARPAKTDFERISNFSNLVVHGIPLFNIWDCISVIYTICVEDIKTQLDAELHLTQFRVIVQALRSAKKYFAPGAGPTTVAATWTAPTHPQPFTIAFATTCVGIKKDPTKGEMAAARREFMTTITSQLQIIPILVPNEPINFAGNCPEFLTWGMICQQQGKYQSLCFNNMANNEEEAKIYECCHGCQDMLYILDLNNIEIEDMWTKSLMAKTGKPKKDKYKAYTYCDMKPLTTIIKEYL
jgi:hypothetical protein